MSRWCRREEEHDSFYPRSSALCTHPIVDAYQIVLISVLSVCGYVLARYTRKFSGERGISLTTTTTTNAKGIIMLPFHSEDDGMA
jgi:hypothetical protein